MSHKKLKEETKELHKELDQLSLNKKLMTASVTLSDYKLFLIAQFKVYAFLKSSYNTIDLSFIQPVKDRYLALKKDLLELEVEVDDIRLMTLENLETDSNDQHLLGLKYVIEGSRHGAVYIKKHIEKQLGLNDKCLQFLGFNSTIDWDLIIHELDQEEDTLSVKQGAVYGYKLFITSFKAETLNKYE